MVFHFFTRACLFFFWSRFRSRVALAEDAFFALLSSAHALLSISLLSAVGRSAFLDPTFFCSTNCVAPRAATTFSGDSCFLR